MYTTLQSRMRAFQLLCLVLYSTLSIARLIPRSDSPHLGALTYKSQNESHLLFPRIENVVMTKDWPQPVDGAPKNSWQFVHVEMDEDTLARDDIRAYAKQGYENCRAQTRANQKKQLVAALWIPGVGIYLSSILADTGARSEVAKLPADNEAPRWRDQVLQDRSKIGDITHHAEDGACWLYERERSLYGQDPLSGTAQYPSSGGQQPFVAVYGVRDNRHLPGPVPACAKCRIVLYYLGIQWDIVDDSTNGLAPAT